MKSISFRRLFLLALLAPLFTLTASADDPVEDNGIYYNLVPKGKIATVTKKEVQKQNEWGETYTERYSGSIVIPSTFTYSGTTYSVVGIEDYAFEGSGVTSVTIPNSVTSIGRGAFNNCGSLTFITIPNSITSIPSSCFYECRSLNSITIPESVTYIDGSTFYGCSSLTSITIPNSVPYISPYTFADCSSLTTITIPNSVTIIWEGAFQNCSSLASITIPNSVAEIDFYAFDGCRGLTSVNIPNSVTKIRSYAFQNCSSLTSITIPNSVDEINDYTFYGCSSLTSVTIPESVISIGTSAFQDCSLTSLSIGEGIQSIGSRAFAKNEELTDVYCYAMNVPYTDNAFEGSFVGYATLYVPASTISLYQADAVWGQFGTITALGSASKYYKLSVDVNDKGKVVYGDGVNANTIMGTSQTFDVKENENIELTLTPNAGYKLGSVTVNGVDKTTDVTSEGKLMITDVNGDQTVNVEFVYAGSLVSVTIGELGTATFCCEEALDFSGTNDVKAYIASAYNPTTGQVTLTRITDVPAGTGIVLLGDEGTYNIPLGTGSTYVVNMLVGVDADKVLNKTEGANSNFILSDGEKGVGFYAVSSGTTLAAGKAYLSLPTAALPTNAQSIGLRFGDATGIASPQASPEGKGDWFDLSGRRIDGVPAAPGLYIKNGKKVLIK